MNDCDGVPSCSGRGFLCQILHENRGNPKLTDNLVPLIDVIRSWEENSASDHLAHDAANRPNVDVLLVSHAQNDLRRTIISRHNVRRHHERRAGSSGESKVEDLQGAV
jgi:hypothetical protein